MPRTYRSGKTTPRLSVVKPEPAKFEIPKNPGIPPKWEDGARMHTLKDAVKILTAELGRGHSYPKLLNLIGSGQLVEGYHWWKTGSVYKVNITRFIEWSSTPKG